MYDRLTTALGYELADLGKLSRIRGSVVGGPSGYRLALEVVEQQRRSSRLIESESCDDLVDAAVLAILLALAPESVATAAPEPLPEELPASADAAQGEPAARTVNLASEGVRVRGFASAGGVVELGALPSPALGVAFGAGVRFAAESFAAESFAAESFAAVSFGGYGALLATEQVTVRPGTTVELDLWFAGVRACYAWLDAALSLDACAGFEAGQLGALGLDLAEARRVRELWLAPSVALAAQLALSGPLQVEVRTEAALPQARKQYTVNGNDRVHAPDVVSSRIYVGLILSTE